MNGPCENCQKQTKLILGLCKSCDQKAEHIEIPGKKKSEDMKNLIVSLSKDLVNKELSFGK